MKRIFIAICICLGLSACGSTHTNNEPNNNGEKTKKQTGIEVLYFHGKQRCAICIAIEKNAKEIVETRFADQVKNGDIAFKSIDINKNTDLAEKYKVTWSSIFIVKYTENKEYIENLTEFAFNHARTAPDKFKEGLSTKIEKMLKQ